MNAVNNLAELAFGPETILSTTNQSQCNSDDCFAAGEEV